MNLVPLGRQAQIVTHDIFPAKSVSQKIGCDDFNQFSPVRARSGILHPGHLHGDGGCPLSRAACDIVERRPHHGRPVHSGMFKKTLVLDGDEAGCNSLREDLRYVPESSYRIGVSAFKEVIPKTVFQERGRGWWCEVNVVFYFKDESQNQEHQKSSCRCGSPDHGLEGMALDVIGATTTERRCDAATRRCDANAKQFDGRDTKNLEQHSRNRKDY